MISEELDVTCDKLFLLFKESKLGKFQQIKEVEKKFYRITVEELSKSQIKRMECSDDN